MSCPCSTTTATSTPTCTGSVVEPEASDNCTTFAVAYNISTWELLRQNGLASCNDFSTNSSFCVGDQCDVYVPVAGDDCLTLAKANNITRVQLMSWNPQLDQACSNFNESLGESICISNPLPYTAPNTTTTVLPLTTATADATEPTNVAPNTTTHCGRYYQTVEGDECAPSE
jgi:hypothetical protein